MWFVVCGSVFLFKKKKATKVWSESTVARIMKLTEEAQSSKPKLERWLDEFTERYSQLVVAMSVAVAVLGPFVFKWPFLGSPGWPAKESACPFKIQ